MEYFKLSKFLSPIFETPNGTGSWFGYYNYDTLNYDQTKMLSHRTDNDAKNICKGMFVDIGYYDIPSGDWHKIGTSDSYSWPQGAMLQWLPGDTNQNKIIYNLSKDNKLISRIHDINTGDYRDINWAIYGIHPSGNKSIAIDMERSYWCRAYHYESVANPELNCNVPEGDGVFEIDLVNNTRKRIISIQDIISIDSEPYFQHAKHWLEHIMISPSGKRFCFLHRFTTGSLNEYETRLFVADIDGGNLQIIEGWRNFYWSHFGWNGDDEFVIYAYKILRRKNKNFVEPSVSGNQVGCQFDIKNKIIKLLKLPVKILPKKILQEINYRRNGFTSYYQYYGVDSNGHFSVVKNICGNNFVIDGHPSFTKDARYMITDTYPDSNQYQKLIIYDMYTGRSLKIAEIYAGLHRKPGTCDLHPKLCNNNNLIVVDTAYNGLHHMCLFRLNWELIKKEIG